MDQVTISISRSAATQLLRTLEVLERAHTQRRDIGFDELNFAILENYGEVDGAIRAAL